MKFHRLEKALITSAFFIACLFSTAAYSSAPQRQSKPTCSSFAATETASIRYIHDGDTVFLNDNRKVRLIGIDTPELARRKKNKYSPEQPFARDARDFARDLIRQYGKHVQLMPGIEKTDRYQRELFHIQLSDGSLLQSRLLQAGLAIAYTVPPNQKLSSCYQKNEQFARHKQSKIWAHPKYQPISVDKLNSSNKGFHIISGKVRHIGESKKAFWLNFYGKFSVRINKRDMKYFHTPLQQLLEKEIVVRGWLRHYKNKAQISLRHPSAMRLPKH